MTRTPPKFFVEALLRFDPNLRVRWSDEDVVLPPIMRNKRDKKPTKGPMNRWRIEIWNERSKRYEHVMWVVAKNFEYRDLGEDIFAKLRQADSQQYGIGTAEWNMSGRRQLMNNLGMKEDLSDPYMEAMDEMIAHRYHENVGELADRIKHIIKQDNSICAPTGNAEKEMMAKLEAKEGVNDALEQGKGKIVLDKELGVARRID